MQKLQDYLDTPDKRLAPRRGLACEPQLRVAAATLSRAPADEITAATVVGILGADDLSSFARLIGELADQYGLEASTEMTVGSFSVRFTRRVVPAPEPPSHGLASWLRRHVRHTPPRPRQRRASRRLSSVETIWTANRDARMAGVEVLVVEDDRQTAEYLLPVYVARLRQKLEDDPWAPRYRLNQCSLGYRLATSTSYALA